MSFPGPVIEAVVGILVLAALLGSAVLLKGTARIPSLMFAIPGVIALKHGFVGNTGMSTGYFIFMVVAASVVFLLVETRAEWRVAGFLWALTCAAAIFKGVFMIAWPPITLEGLRHRLSGQAGIQAFHNVWDSEKLAQEFQIASSQILAQEHLPARWVADLKSLPGGVDVFPWELTYLPANDLPWRPSLVLQHYSAYTHALDQAMADTLGSQSGPSALLLEFTGLSGRHMLTDTPLTFRRILADYEAVDTDYSRNLLSIRRRANPPARALNTPVIPSTRIGFDEWVTLPHFSGKLFAQFFIKPTVTGFMRQILWKTSPVYLRLEYESGDTAEYRILPATASGGVLINYLPRTLQDLADLMAGCAFNKVRRFQLYGPGAASFQRHFDVTWIPDKSPFADYSHLQRRSLPEVVSIHADSPDRQARMMTVTARDGDGYRCLKFVQIIANETDSYDGGCYLRYEVDRRILWLMNGRDRATGAGELGEQQVLEDGVCTVNLAGSWPEFRGDTLSLHLDLALKPKIRATQRVFARAIDEKGIESKLTEFASWKPPAGEVRENPWDFPPTPPSLTVESKKLAGREKYALRVGASDLNGAEDIDAVEVIVNNVVDGRNTCYLRYDRRANTVSLVDDSGTPSRARIEPGSSKQLSNSYCAIAVPDSPSVKGSYDVYFTFELALTEKMLTKRTIYLSAIDREGLRQSWKAYANLPTEPTLVETQK